MVGVRDRDRDSLGSDNLWTTFVLFVIPSLACLLPVFVFVFVFYQTKGGKGAFFDAAILKFMIDCADFKEANPNPNSLPHPYPHPNPNPNTNPNLNLNPNLNPHPNPTPT